MIIGRIHNRNRNRLIFLGRNHNRNRYRLIILGRNHLNVIGPNPAYE